MGNDTAHRDEEPAPGVYGLNCGQADAHLIVTPAGTKGLIDADRGQVVEELNEVFGRTGDGTNEITLDFLYTTHIHEDHVFGIRDLHDAGYVIEEAYQPPTARFKRDVKGGVKSTVAEEYFTALSAHGIERDDIQEVTIGDTILREGDVALTALSPPATGEPIEFDHPITGEPCEYGCALANPNSAACRYDGPHNSYLFMGDIENKRDHDAEPWLIKQHVENEIDLDADVLIMGHHGSNNAGNRSLLETIDQDWTMISADSTYHPATETLKTLQAATDSNVSVTGTHGRTAFTNGLPPTPTNPDASTEPWRIDRDKHTSMWSEIVGQERTKNEQLKEKKEHLAAQLDPSPTIIDRIRSIVPFFGKRNKTAITDTEESDTSNPEATQAKTDRDNTENTTITREEEVHALGLKTPSEIQQSNANPPRKPQNDSETTGQTAKTTGKRTDEVESESDEELDGDSSVGAV